MSARLEILKPEIDKRLLETAAQLLHEIRSGQITDLAYVARHRGDLYSGDVVGHMRQSPDKAIPLAQALLQILSGTLLER